MFSEQNKNFTPSLNFQVFYRIFNKQKLGVFATTIIILLSFLELCCFFFNEIALITYTDSSLLQYIRTFASYASTLALIKIDLGVYIAARYLAPFANIAYLLLFLTARSLTSQGTVSNSLDRFVGLGTLYYTRIALIPIFEILFREVSCDEEMFTAINQECLTGVNIFAFVLAVIGIVCGLIMTMLTLYYSMNGIYDKKNYMSGENRLWDASLAFVHIMTPLLVIVGGKTYTLIMVHIAFHLACSTFLLWYFMTFYPYNKIFIEYVAVIYVTIYWIDSLVSIIGVGIQSITPDVGALYGLTLVVSVPGVAFVYITMKRRLIIKTTTKSSGVLLRQIQAILQLKSSEKLSSEEETYFRGLISRHKVSCHNLHCFCKRDELYDPKKDKDFEAVKWPMLKTLVLKYYVRFLFEEAIENGTSDSALLISYAEFLFHKFRNTHLAVFQIHKLLQSNRFLYPNERLRILKLQERISGYINSRNLEALEKPLEIEHVIFIEEQLEKVLQGMQKIISTSIAFWSYLTNKDIELDKLRNLADEMHKSVEETTALWNPLKPYLYKQKKIMYYYNWFLKDFLQKKIILSEEEVDDLFENDTASFYSNDFFSTLKDDHVLFQEDTAVVHMSGDNHDLGKILKTNNGALKVFGYNQEEMEKANVDILMPNIIAHRHQYYLNSFIITGKSEVLYNQRKTFAKDKRGHIMPIWIVVKQLNNLEGHVQYAGLMRPLSQKKDEQNYYILMNNFGEISGVSKNFTEFVHVREEIFQKTEVNIIMLAPKLIKYFFFSKMLHNDISTVGTMGSNLIHQEGSKTITSFSSALKSRKFSEIINVARRSPLKAFLELDDLKDEDEVVEKDEEKEERDAQNEDGEYKDEKDDYYEIEFTLRIPKKLKSFVKEFNQLKSRHYDLLNNQKLLLEAIKSKTLGGKSVFEDFGSVPSGADSPTRKKKFGHFTSFKHAVDAYIGALKYTADKLVKAGQNNVYRVKGVIATDYYGPDKDVIKYLKILEIVKKNQKISQLTTVPLSHKNSEESDFTQSNSFHNLQTLKGFRKSVKIAKFEKFEKEESSTENNPTAKEGKEEPEQTEDPKARLLEGETPKDSQDLGDPESFTSRSKSLKVPGSMKSLQKSEELGENEDNADNESFDRQAINNELKNNILTHSTSIYQKEDHMLIDRQFRGLRNVNWFIIILFLSLIPLNLITYLVGPWKTFRNLGNSIDDIFSNEDLRRNYIRCHNAITTLILNNNGTFDDLRATDSAAIDAMVQYELDIIDSAYQHIYDGSSKDEWTTILYNYAPKAVQNVQLDYEGSFSGTTTTIQNAIQQLMNSLFTIKFYETTDFTADDQELIFYRINSFEKFNKILGDVTLEIFNILGNNLDSSENLSILILILEGVLFFLSFFVLMRLILVVIWSLREILVIFTVIDNQQVLETVKHYSRLMEILEASNACYMTMMHGGPGNLGRKELYKIKSLKYIDDQKQRLQKKVKRINNTNFMRNDTIKILGYYAISILLCLSLSLVFHFECKVTIDFIQSALADGQRFIQLSPTYITSLIALKELYFNQTDYQEYNLPFMPDTISQLETTLSRTGYNSNLGFVSFLQDILDGTPCETFISLMPDVTDQVACNYIGTGNLDKGLALSSGLISFHNGYSNAVFDILTLDNAGQFGSYGPLDLYELGLLIKIIDDIFMEDTLTKWQSNMKSYLTSKERFLALLIAFVSILNVGVYFVAKRVVVGVLQERFYFYRKIYNEYMLGEAPVKEKRIKAVLVKYKLLHK